MYMYYTYRYKKVNLITPHIAISHATGRSKATKLPSSTSMKRTLPDSIVQSEVPHPKHSAIEQSSIRLSGNEQPPAQPQTCVAQVVPDSFEDEADFSFPQSGTVEAAFLGPTLSSTNAAKHIKKPSKQSQVTPIPECDYSKHYWGLFNTPRKLSGGPLM